MRAIVFSKEKGQLLEREFPTPTPQKNEVLVKINFLLLTQKDLKKLTPESEIIPGRFFIGEVIATGNDVKDYAPGDIVSGITTFFCGACKACENSEYHLCENPVVPGRDINGFFVEFATIKPDFLLKIPPEIPNEKAVFLPLIAELLTYIPEKIQPGVTGVIAASGIEEIIFNRLLQISGFIETAILSTSTRLRTFLKPGLKSHYTEEPSSLLQLFEEYAEKPDFAFDFTGNLQFIKNLLQVLKPGGTLFLTEIPLNDAQNILETAKINGVIIRMKNLLSIKDKISYTIKILQTHAIQPEDYITHILNLNDFEKIGKILQQEPSLIMVTI